MKIKGVILSSKILFIVSAISLISSFIFGYNSVIGSAVALLGLLSLLFGIVSAVREERNAIKENKLAGFGHLFKESIRDFGSRFGIVAAFSAITFAIGVVFPLLIGIGVVIGIGNLLLGTIIGALSALIFLFAAWLVNGAFMYSMKDGAKFKESFKFIWKNFKPYAWIALLSFFAIFSGMIALIIPGIIMAIFLMFSAFVFMDDGTKGIAALKKSKEYVKGRFWAIIGRSTLFLLVVAGANLVIGILGQPILQPLFSAFVVAPVSLCFYWRLFKDIKAKKPEPASGEGNKSIKVFTIIGMILFSAIVVIGFVFIFTNLPAVQQSLKEAATEMIAPTDGTESGNPISDEDAQELERLLEGIQNSQ